MPSSGVLMRSVLARSGDLRERRWPQAPGALSVLMIPDSHVAFTSGATVLAATRGDRAHHTRIPGVLNGVVTASRTSVGP